MGSFIEHDVNEFGKKLFSAMEMTLGCQALGINSLFNISSVSFVHCSNCNFRSEKTDVGSDLNLVVNNPLTRERFSKMELSLLNTLKPEVLDGSNCYFCSKCNAKHPAKKGLEYLDFPKILMFNCNRFVFDLNTFQRVKVNDEFDFPLELDMSSFIGKFDEVKEQLKQTKPELFVEKPKPAPAKKKLKRRKWNLKNRKDKIQEGFQTLHTSRKGKKFQNKKSSKRTKDFLKNCRKNFTKFKKSFNSAPQVENFIVEKGSKTGDFKMIDEVNEVKIYTSVKTENSTINPLGKTQEKVKNSISEMLENEQKLSNDQDRNSSDKSVTGKLKKVDLKNGNSHSNGKTNGELKQNGKEKNGHEAEITLAIDNNDETRCSISEAKESSQDEKENLKKPICKSLKNQNTENVIIKKPEIKEEVNPLEGGLQAKPLSPPSISSTTPNTNQFISPDPVKGAAMLNQSVKKNNLKYQLYAIFIHKGTAYAGHYYIYIKSFETNQWYLFDDSQVTEVNLVNVLRDSVGGNSTPANAYMLAYRRVDEKKFKPAPLSKIETEKPLETVHETLSLGKLESSNKKTVKEKEGK